MNSIFALSNTSNPQFILKSFIDKENVLIKLIGNGIGITRGKPTDIFIPFYSSKEKGSGIGLSFARQIMRLHNGSINVQLK